MVDAATARLVLTALADALPPEGNDVVTRIDIHRGWGDVIQIRIHSRLARDAELAGSFRRAVAAKLEARHRIEIVWASTA